MLCFARLIRCAIVASGTRNALRDLGGRQAADRAQRQRDRRRRRQRGMAAHEEQDERVVLLGVASSSAAARSARSACTRPTTSLAPAARDLAADVIGHAPRRDLDQPAARVVGHALARPLLRRGDQRLLHRVLGRGEVAEAPDDRAEHLRRELAQQVLGRGRPAAAASQPVVGRRAHHLRAPRSPCSAARRRARARPTPRAAIA